MSKYEKCCCFTCISYTENNNPDCGCDEIPMYSREQCMDCPKRHFCDVTKQPQEYMEAETQSASPTNTDYTAVLEKEINNFVNNENGLVPAQYYHELAAHLNSVLHNQNCA